MSPSVRQEWDVNSQNCLAQSPYSGRHRDLVEFQRLQFLFEKDKRHLRSKVMVLTLLWRRY